MLLDMSMSPNMEMQVNAALLNLTQLLMLPGVALQQAVEQELHENPSLEEIEREEVPCTYCGGPVVDGLCLRCMSQPDTSAPSPSNVEQEDTDQLLFVAAPQTLTESLLVELQAMLPEQEYPIALSLIGSLDEHGFLVDEPSDIAATINVSEEEFVHVLQQLREIGPPGVATRNVQECLLAQIDALAAQGTIHPYARAIIEGYFDELGAHLYQRIARAMSISVEAVEDAQAFIQQHLWPYPYQGVLSHGNDPNPTRYVAPDIAIVEKEGEFVVDVLHAPRRILRINPLYQQLASDTASLDPEEREHVQEYITRARTFMSNLIQRESTLKQVGEAIIARQQDFLRHGIRHLAPMTRAEIAQDIDMHESTVSRAVADKTALLPNKTLFPISEFFVAARGVEDILRELIENEKQPLSDQELAEMLTKQGYPVARRTVAKYRNRMNILPSNLR